MKKLWPALLIMIVLACGDATSSDEGDTFEIRDLTEQLEERFNSGDINHLMTLYDPAFLHNGTNWDQERQRWELRRIDYYDLDIEDVEIELNDDLATVYCNATFTGLEEVEVFVEPYENGDYSYFWKNNGEWRICGNGFSDGGPSGYSLYVDSDPQGAKIYLDDDALWRFTPASLHGLPRDNYLLRVYMPGYNEWTQSVSVPQNTFVDAVLSLPDYPRPSFDIQSPEDQEHFSYNTVPLEALVRTIDHLGNLTDFDGERCILTVNEIETVIPTQGPIVHQFAIQSGENTLEIRATGMAGNTAWSGPITIFGDF